MDKKTPDNIHARAISKSERNKISASVEEALRIVLKMPDDALSNREKSTRRGFQVACFGKKMVFDRVRLIAAIQVSFYEDVGETTQLGQRMESFLLGLRSADPERKVSVAAEFLRYQHDYLNRKLEFYTGAIRAHMHTHAAKKMAHGKPVGP